MSPLTRTAVALAVLLVCALIVAVPSVGYAAYNAATSKLFPAGTTIGGVDVSGMSQAQAVTSLRSRLGRPLDREATVRVGERTYTVTPRELGADIDVDAAVDEAARQAGQVSWWARLTGTADGPDIEPATTTTSRKKVRELVRTMVEDARVEPENASLDLVNGVPEITSAEPGRRVSAETAKKALTAALADGGTRTVETKKVEPDITRAAYETVIVVDDGTNELRLYEDGELAQVYGVALGMPGHRTPHGTFEVTLKRPSPTWVNPAPNGWGKDMPERIGPGPDNPLGLRALNLDSPGIRIHGTSAVSSIGRDASHGCIRLANSDILDLYPQVPEGATVFITA